MSRPVRRNGIVRVPKLWHDAATEAFFDLYAKGGGSLTIPLPLKALAYPKIRTALKAIYPEGFVPLFFKVGPISAEGSTSTKHDGGYTVAINNSSGSSAASLISTILHELRHVVQYLGDEVVKTKQGTFGRPSKAAVRSLRARKLAMKAGKIPASGMQKYLSSASEWQPWVGSTADKIVGKIIAGNLTKTADVNAAIRAGILSGSFYGGTDPATRKELMRQVYTEVVRQLRGYTDIIPAKHPKAGALKASAPKASAPPGASAYTVRVKIEGAGPQITAEATYAGKDSKGRDKLEVPAADEDAALLTAEQFVQLAKQGSTLHGGTIYAVRIAHKGKESELYVAGAKVLATPPPGYAGGYTAGGLPTDYWQLMGLPPVKGKTPKPKPAPKPKASAVGGVPYETLGLKPDAALIIQKRRLPVGSSAQGAYVAASPQYHVKLKTQIKPGAEVLALLDSGWIRAMKASDYPKMLARPELPAFTAPTAPPPPKAPKSEADALALLATIIPAGDIAKYGPITAVEYYFEGIEYGKPSYWMTPAGQKSALEGSALTPKAVGVLKALGWKKLTAAQWLGKAPMPKGAAASAPKAASASPPPAPGTVSPGATGAYVVVTKIVSAMPSITSEPNYAGKDTSGRDKLASGFDTMNEAMAVAQGIAAQATKGVTFHNGAVYVVRIYDKATKKEHEVYDATKGGENPPGSQFGPKLTPPVAAVFAKYLIPKGQPGGVEWEKGKAWSSYAYTTPIPPKIGTGKSAVPNPDLAILTAAGWKKHKKPKEPSAAGWEMKNPRRTRRPARRTR